MQQLGEAQQHEHWSGQGVLEHLCAETQKRGASDEIKTASDPFSKLLASFETQELLPTLHPSSVLTPSKRQRKSYRPSRVPPVSACETLLAMHDKRSQKAPSEGARMDQSDLIEQQPPASLQAYDTATLSDTQGGKKLKPSSPIMKDFPGMVKLLQNGMKTHDLALPTSLNPEKLITDQKNGWNFKSVLPKDDKLSNGMENNGSESFTYLLNLQQNDKNLDSLCSIVCRNVACQARISLEASFCRRCSCCICKLFDDKRDPSLWILCDPVANGGCGLSCHIECALKQHVAGVVTTTNGSIPSLDGSYFCQSCGAITPLIGCWKEQLSAAKDARSLDIFQYRLLLSYRLLKGTNRHKDTHCFIEEAVKKVDAEVSQLATGSLQRLRCNENILLCNEEVQRLINLALEKADTPILASGGHTKQAGHSMSPCMVCFEDVSSSSIVVTVNDVETFMKPKLLGYKLWHRRANEPLYACTPTSILYNIHDKFVVSNLHPLTDYTFKVVPFSAEGDLAVCEAGCSTKGAEHRESPPLDVYASLDVVLINTKLVGEGTSRCVNQVFNLDYHIDKPKNGLKIQDLEEGLPDQNEQAHHVSSVSPGKEQKNNCECFEGKSSGINPRCGRGENLVHSNIAAAQQDRKLYSLVASGPSKFNQACTGTGNLSMRKSSCQQEKHRIESRHCSSELKSTNKQEFCYGTSANEFCSLTEKTSTTKVLKCEHPSQRWGMQVHGSDNAIAASTQADIGIVQGADDHKQGAVACNAEAEFGNYEFSVKVIRWLECQGHLKEEFRMKFLTWYTLRASEHEKRVVSVFIDTLQDDPAGLGGQLVDAFEDIIETKRQATTPDGYCRRLW